MRRYLLLLIPILSLTSGPGQAGNAAAERLAEAVRFKTISYQDRSRIDYAEYLRFHHFLKSHYPRVFAELDVETVNHYSLLILWPGSDPHLSPVMFTAHMDVVPVEPGTEADWDHPAFAGVIDNGRIYGRGTLDDKQGLLSLLEAAESLLEEGFTPRRTVLFAFGHDEEISGPQGAVALAARLKERGLHSTWMIDEGGFLIDDSPLLPGRPLGLVSVAEKGYLTATLSTKGEGGHSSRPPETGTIGRLSAALERVENSPYPPRLVGPVQAMFETIAPHTDQPQRFIFENLWLTGGLVASQLAEDPVTSSFVRTTTALTMFNAGVKENVIPQYAEAKINFRLLPGDTADTVVARITEIVDDPLVEISYDAWSDPSPISDHTGDGFAVIAEAVAEVYPEAVVVPSLLVATTDSRHYVEVSDNQYRFHGNRLSMAQVNSMHGTNEFLGVESYENMISIARQMLKKASR